MKCARSARGPHAVALVLWSLGSVLATSCGDDAGAEAADEALGCKPDSERKCPCLSYDAEVDGTQRCNAEGTAYSRCECPDAGFSTSLPASFLPGEEPAADPGISCALGLPRVCALGAEQCCVRSLVPSSCTPLGEACECDEIAGCLAMVATCDGPEDCGDGEVCCGTYMIDTSNLQAGPVVAYTGISCVAPAACVFANMQRVICHAGIDECEDGLVCSGSQLLPNYQVCAEPAP